MNIGASVVSDKTAELVRAVKLAAQREVMVGIPSTHIDRNEPGAPAHNAMLGYIHEHGAPAANIPARPHLVPGVQDAQPKIIEQFKKAVEGALKGDEAELDRRLNAAGLVAQNAVRARLNAGIAPALSDATIAARQRRGRMGDKPLIDTAQLRNSYTYVIRKK